MHARVTLSLDVILYQLPQNLKKKKNCNGIWSILTFSYILSYYLYIRNMREYDQFLVCL